MKSDLVFENNVQQKTAFLQLNKYIYESFEKNQFSLGETVDLGRALDTVNHQILINKLKYFGITEIYLEFTLFQITENNLYLMITTKYLA